MNDLWRCDFIVDLALAGGVQNPSREPSVISDEMILSAVQTIAGTGGS